MCYLFLFIGLERFDGVGFLNSREALKNENIFLVVRKYRPENRSLHGVNEDLRTELTPPRGK